VIGSSPSYRHYTPKDLRKPKDLAVVRIKGKDHYLGKYDWRESWGEYDRLIADHIAPAQRLNSSQKRTVQATAADPPVSESPGLLQAVCGVCILTVGP
jgi:hypothetical protein